MAKSMANWSTFCGMATLGFLFNSAYLIFANVSSLLKTLATDKLA